MGVKEFTLTDFLEPGCLGTRKSGFMGCAVDWDISSISGTPTACYWKFKFTAKYRASEGFINPTGFTYNSDGSYNENYSESRTKYSTVSTENFIRCDVAIVSGTSGVARTIFGVCSEYTSGIRTAKFEDISFCIEFADTSEIYVDKTTYYLDEYLNYNIESFSSEFTHNISMSLNGTVIYTQNIDKNILSGQIYLDPTWNVTTNGNEVSITLETFNNNVLIGTKSVKITVKKPGGDSVVKIIFDGTSPMYKNIGEEVTIGFTGTGPYNSAIETWSIDGSGGAIGFHIDSNTATIIVPDTSNDCIYTCTGYSKEVSGSASVTIKPVRKKTTVIESFSASRLVNPETNLYIYCTFDYPNGEMPTLATVQKCIYGDANWTNVGDIDITSSSKTLKETYQNVLDLDKAYDIRITLKRNNNEVAVSQIVRISSTGIFMFWDAFRNSIGFGCVPKRTRTIEIAADWSVYYGDELIHGNGSQPVDLIITGPNDVTVTEGNEARFEVSVNGSVSTYQWQQKINGSSIWSDIQGAQSSSYSVSSPSLSMSGYQYRCYVNSNNYSRAATLTVNGATQPLTVTISPSSVTCVVGENRQLTVTASGGKTPYTYEWYRKKDENTEKINNETASSYSFTATYDRDNGSKIYCKVTDSNGSSKNTNDVSITVNQSSTLTVTVADQTVNVGGTAIFTANVSGATGVVTYKWDKWINQEWQVISGANTDKLYVTDVQLPQNNTYYCCTVIEGGKTAASNPYPVLYVVDFKYTRDLTSYEEASVSNTSTTGPQAFIAIATSSDSQDQISYNWYIRNESDINWRSINGVTGFTAKSDNNYSNYLEVNNVAYSFYAKCVAVGSHSGLSVESNTMYCVYTAPESTVETETVELDGAYGSWTQLFEANKTSFSNISIYTNKKNLNENAIISITINVDVMAFNTDNCPLQTVTFNNKVFWNSNKQDGFTENKNLEWNSTDDGFQSLIGMFTGGTSNIECCVTNPNEYNASNGVSYRIRTATVTYYANQS